MIEDFYEILQPGNIAVFCGAGISKNSGLPLAGELLHGILSRLIKKQEHLEAVKADAMAFEEWLGLFDSYSDVRGLVLLFREGLPNVNHKLIAWMAKSGVVKDIVTTDFDCLIETELTLSDVPYNIFADESELSQVANTSRDRVTLLKIHGSVDRPNTVRSTIWQVSRHDLAAERERALDRIFRTGDHKVVMFLGYSHSDYVDVVPYFRSLPSCDKYLLLVQHSRESRTTDLTDSKYAHLFPGMQGEVREIDTDVFVQDLFRALFFFDGVTCFTSTTQWQMYVDAWVYEVAKESWRQNLLIANVFENVEVLGVAQGYAEAALELARARARETERVESGRADFERQFSHGSVLQCLDRLARIAIKREDLDAAESYLAEYEQIGSQSELAYARERYGAQFLIGQISMRRRRFDHAIEYFKKSIQSIASSQVVTGIFDIATYTNPARAASFDEFSRHPSIIDELDVSLWEFVHPTYRRDVANCFFHIGVCLRHAERDGEAAPYFDRAVALYAQIGDLQGELQGRFRLGDLRGLAGDFAGAIAEFKRAESIIETIGDRQQMALVYRKLMACLVATGARDEFSAYGERLKRLAGDGSDG